MSAKIDCEIITKNIVELCCEFQIFLMTTDIESSKYILNIYSVNKL